MGQYGHLLHHQCRQLLLLRLVHRERRSCRCCPCMLLYLSLAVFAPHELLALPFLPARGIPLFALPERARVVRLEPAQFVAVALEAALAVIGGGGRVRRGLREEVEVGQQPLQVHKGEVGELVAGGSGLDLRG